jgi:hypothetical protein
LVFAVIGVIDLARLGLHHHQRERGVKEKDIPLVNPRAEKEAYTFFKKKKTCTPLYAFLPVVPTGAQQCLQI